VIAQQDDPLRHERCSDLKKKHAIRLRVTVAPDTLLGPGKADLLQGIKETGSIAAAGRRMGMSYKRAWYLLDTMNSTFREPLATATKGGKSGGGAQLTETGLAVLTAFRRMEAAAKRAVAKEMAKLTALMR
jgi:molybdate transport system regulatory protein